MADAHIASEHSIVAVQRRSPNRTSDEAIEECRRLRTEERLSLQEISARSGVPKGTLSPYLRDIPLTDVEVLVRRRAAVQPMLLARRAKVRLRIKSPFFDIIQSRVKTTDQKGAIAEAAAIFRLKVWGLVPHLPLCAGGKSDIAVLVPDTGRLLRVQVKSVRRHKYGQPHASLKSRSGGKIGVRYSDADFDFFVGYDPFEDVCYIYSVNELVGNKGNKSMSLSHAERWDKLIAP